MLGFPFGETVQKLVYIRRKCICSGAAVVALSMISAGK